MSNGREPIFENSQIRSLARQQLKGNWGKAIISLLVYIAISYLVSIVPLLGVMVSLVIGGPMTLGITKYFLQLKRGQNPAIEALFDGFKNFLPSFLLPLISGIFVFLWSLLLVIPGIIASLRYSMAFFILNDNPELTAMDALNKSKEMMVGHKGRLFMLYLSFIGWAILCAFTFGIGGIFLVPYMYVSFANFYDNLKNNQSPMVEEQSNPLFNENPHIF